MDPVTVVILVFLFVLSGGGGAVSVARSRRAQKRRDMRDAIRQRVEVADKLEVSLFDVFWDLGVSEYALEIMGNQQLLIRDLQDLPVALDALADAVAVHGSYAAFIHETLETIQEFYDEHRRAGNRRALPGLQTRPTKTLELPAVVGDDKGDDRSNLPVPYTGSFQPVVARNFNERISARSGGAFAPLVTNIGGYEVDVDALTRVDPMRWIKGAIDGRFGKELERWWEMRNVRTLRDELDRMLAGFYTFYVDQVARTPGFYAQLYDTSNRWDLEARRIADLLERKSWRGKPWSMCGEAMFKEAMAVSKQLSWLARNNVDQTIGQIHDCARRGDMSMAGYLVYLNHHAFFAGRSADYSEHVRRIETSTYRLQEELRDLQQRGVV